MSRRRAPARRRPAPVKKAQPANMKMWLVITVVVILWIKYQETHG